MNTAEQVLVIMLASALAVFLVLGIVVLVKVVQILNHVRAITEKAEHIAEQAEAVGAFFQKTAGPVALGKLISNITDHLFQAKDAKKRGSRRSN
jgi:hypothetical protein